MKYSAAAGALAALAGVLGKLGADDNTAILQSLEELCMRTAVVPCEKVPAIVRFAFIGLMLATNALMLNLFVKGLHETDSLTATITSAAVNFMLSAAGGLLLFGELLPMQWFLGATVMLVGMGFLMHGDAKPEENATPAPASAPTKRPSETKRAKKD